MSIPHKVVQWILHRSRISFKVAFISINIKLFSKTNPFFVYFINRSYFDENTQKRLWKWKKKTWKNLPECEHSFIDSCNSWIKQNSRLKSTRIDVYSTKIISHAFAIWQDVVKAKLLFLMRFPNLLKYLFTYEMFFLENSPICFTFKFLGIFGWKLDGDWSLGPPRDILWWRSMWSRDVYCRLIPRLTEYLPTYTPYDL